MKISNIVIFLMLITFTGSNSFAETKENCSKFSTDTVQGTIKKMKCDKREGKGITSKLAQKLKDDKFYQECSITCRELYEKSLYTEKNFVPYITDILEGLL